MDTELVSLVINLVTALSAVAGVVLATVLGSRAIAIASETVERASLDYAAGRADLITQSRVALFEAMAELKAAMHVFWKEDPRKLLDADPGSSRAKELIQQRNAAEVETHRAMYRLQGAAERLREVLPSAEIIERERSWKPGAGHGTVQGVRAPIGVDMPAALELVRLYERGAMALYLSLVVDNRYTDPKRDPDVFMKDFLTELHLYDADEGQASWLPRVQAWLAKQLSVISDQCTPEIIAINFVESFLDRELAEAVHAVTDSVLSESRAGVVVRS